MCQLMFDVIAEVLREMAMCRLLSGCFSHMVAHLEIYSDLLDDSPIPYPKVNNLTKLAISALCR